jgi:hypothetical protein
VFIVYTVTYYSSNEMERGNNHRAVIKRANEIRQSLNMDLEPLPPPRQFYFNAEDLNQLGLFESWERCGFSGEHGYSKGLDGGEHIRSINVDMKMERDRREEEEIVGVG